MGILSSWGLIPNTVILWIYNDIYIYNISVKIYIYNHIYIYSSVKGTIVKPLQASTTSVPPRLQKHQDDLLLELSWQIAGRMFTPDTHVENLMEI